MALARWVDLGCPINTGEGTSNAAFGWFLDDVRPALAVSLPRPGANSSPLTAIRVGVADAYTGIAPGTLSITASVPINGRPAGAQLADLAQPAGAGIYVIALDPPLAAATDAHLYVQVADRQGNLTRVDRKFSVGQTVLGERVFVPLAKR